ncbi:MAG TPA: NAD(P)H-binding protein, partial [Candidatus Angelobacter sp.]|nr:NAD(P)H-binding protein [Candidatus Angelobacter sp.]
MVSIIPPAAMPGTTTRNVFVTGGTGYLGRFLLPALVRRGHTVTALVRQGSEKRLSSGVRAVFGDALNHSTFKEQIKPADTFVQLVGVPHPGPAKAAQFRSIDLVSVRESVAAAVPAGIHHFVYLSVAQPAPVMHAYLAV